MEYNKRVAYLGATEDDPKLTGNRQIYVNIVSTLPMLSGTMVDRYINSDDVVKNVLIKEETATPSKTDNTNILVDPTYKDIDGNDKVRYTYLGESLSLVTNHKAVFYYDDKFGDMIVVPETALFGDPDDTELGINNILYINGHNINQGTDKQFPMDTLELPVADDTYQVIRFPIASRFDKTTTILANVAGFSDDSMCKVRYLDVSSSDDKSTTNRVLPIQFIQLPDVSDIFGNGTKIGTRSIVSGKLGEYVTLHNGIKPVSKVIIPLSF